MKYNPVIMLPSVGILLFDARGIFLYRIHVILLKNSVVQADNSPNGSFTDAEGRFREAKRLA